MNEKLTSILYAIDNYESSDKCFSSEVERQNAIKRLMQSQQELAELETNNKSLDKILGKDKEVEAYVDSAGRMLSAQITRLSRLNPILSDSVVVSSVNEAENILLVGYRKNQNRNIDIAVRCNDSFQEKDSVRILIVVENKEKALFYQCYYFKHGINCFIIPSFNEDVTTYIGYISGLDNVYNRLKLKI